MFVMILCNVSKNSVMPCKALKSFLRRFSVKACIYTLKCVSGLYWRSMSLYGMSYFAVLCSFSGIAVPVSVCLSACSGSMASVFLCRSGIDSPCHFSQLYKTHSHCPFTSTKNLVSSRQLVSHQKMPKTTPNPAPFQFFSAASLIMTHIRITHITHILYI